MVVTVGVLFMALIALMALTVDSGVLHNERQELQNGADAAALAVAFSCARGSCDTALATEYAVANARTGGSTTVEAVNIDPTAQTVEVITRTADTPLEAMKASGPDAALVRARGKARWGAVGAAATAPFVISECDVETGLALQGGLLPATPPPSGAGVVIPFHDSTQTDVTLIPKCPSHTGMDSDGDGFMPGGFGKIVVDENCKVTTRIEVNADGTEDEWIDAKTGTAMPPDWRCLNINSVMAIPVFGDYRVISGADEYRIVTYVGFYVTGYRFPGYQNNPPNCKSALATQLGVPVGAITGQAYCVSGHFVNYTIADGAFCTDPSLCPFGIMTARMTY